MSSNNLGKYEYLTGEDLGLKPSTIEQAKFEYFPLAFNKGLNEDDEEEGLFKRLKSIESNIKGENKKESEPIKNEDQSTMLNKKSKKIVQ